VPKNTITTTIALVTALALTGCAPEAPKCGDPATLDLLRRILIEQFAGRPALAPEVARKVLDISMPRAIDKNEAIRKYTCEATLQVGASAVLTVKYNSQADDDNRHLVTADPLTFLQTAILVGAIEAGLESYRRSAGVDSPQEKSPTPSRASTVETALPTQPSASEPSNHVSTPLAAPSASTSISTSTGAESKGPSFDCMKASTTQEHLICNDQGLARQDLELSLAYSAKMRSSSNPTSIKTEQGNWLRNVRNKCSDRQCLEEAYQQRTQQLTN